MAKPVIAIDTCVFIYLFEDHPRYAKKAASTLRKIETGKATGVFSSIGMIEILTGPKKAGQFELVQRYRDLVTQFPHLDIIGLTEPIIERASDLRATHGIATPDAIHLATAIETDASIFITNDKRLQKIPDIPVQLLT